MAARVLASYTYNVHALQPVWSTGHCRQDAMSKLAHGALGLTHGQGSQSLIRALQLRGCTEGSAGETTTTTTTHLTLAMADGAKVKWSDALSLTPFCSGSSAGAHDREHGPSAIYYLHSSASS